MAAIDKDKQEFFRRKLTIALLGESSMMTSKRVSELCQKFFDYGIEYANKKQNNN